VIAPLPQVLAQFHRVQGVVSPLMGERQHPSILGHNRDVDYPE